MLRMSILRFSIISSLLLLNLSCSSAHFNTKQLFETDGKYDSEFPYKNGSAQLEQISNTIYRVSSVAFYRTYTFDSKSKFKKSDLTDEIIKKNFIKTTVIDKPALGTGTLIYSNRQTVGILTCAHVVNFPDTVITYFAESNGIFSDYVQSISFKTRENIYVAGFPEGSQVDIILMDEDLDVALLGRQFGGDKAAKFPVFNYSFGNAKELEWGSFVYLLGYPLNYKILSRALVSSPNYDKDGSFLIDAPINRGFSGGMILAVRDGVPNFELVGIVQSVPEENENVLEPSPIDEKFKYSSIVPYTGDSFVKQINILKYGIAKVIPIDVILNFLRKNKEYLISKGYFLNIFK